MDFFHSAKISYNFTSVSRACLLFVCVSLRIPLHPHYRWLTWSAATAPVAPVAPVAHAVVTLNTTRWGTTAKSGCCIFKMTTAIRGIYTVE